MHPASPAPDHSTPPRGASAPPRGALFDLDGLMVDTERKNIELWQSAAKEFGYDLANECFSEAIGKRREEAHRVLRAAFPPGFPWDEVAKRREELLIEFQQSGTLERKLGIGELLQFLEECGVPKAVATASGRDWAHEKLRRTGLAPHFNIVVTGDDVSHAKPSPDVYLEAARRLQIPPEECFAFEDSDVGIQAAHAAGTRPIMVPDMKQPEAAIRALAHHVAQDLYEVKDYLSAFFTPDTSSQQHSQPDSSTQDGDSASGA